MLLLSCADFTDGHLESFQSVFVYLGVRKLKGLLVINSQ